MARRAVTLIGSLPVLPRHKIFLSPPQPGPQAPPIAAWGPRPWQTWPDLASLYGVFSNRKQVLDDLPHLPSLCRVVTMPPGVTLPVGAPTGESLNKQKQIGNYGADSGCRSEYLLRRSATPLGPIGKLHIPNRNSTSRRFLVKGLVRKVSFAQV